MDDQDQARNLRSLLVDWGGRVPRPWAVLLAALLQLLLLPLFILPHDKVILTAVPETYVPVVGAGGGGPLTYSAKGSSPTRAGALHLRRSASARARRAAIEGTGFAVQGSISPGERVQAEKGTAAITSSIRMRQIYGFSPGDDYQLAVQTDGKLPPISPDEVPPRYEQFVTVEVTIGSDGRVEQARVVSGLVSDNIQHKLLAAIREFKYRPATRDGIPIPSQRDIVVHVPG